MFNNQFSTINAQRREEPQNIEQGILNDEVEKGELQRHRGEQVISYNVLERRS
jgi:hypothetical protein